MLTAKIIRQPSEPFGTFGDFTIEDLHLISLELPWKKNKSRISCIPTGTYECVWRKSPSKGWCYHVLKVPGRSNILIHVGNWAGEKPLRSDVLGCLLLGLRRSNIYGQQAVAESRKALKLLEVYTNKEPFTLEIS